MTLAQLLGNWLIEKGFKSWEAKYFYTLSNVITRVVMSHSDHLGLTRMILEDDTKIVKIEYLLKGNHVWYNLTNSTLDMSDPDSFDKLETMLKELK